MPTGHGVGSPTAGAPEREVAPLNDRRRSVAAAAWDHTHDAQLASAIMSGEAQVRSPKLTVGFSQSSYV